LVVSQTGTAEPVLASNVDLSSATGIPAAGITGTLGSGVAFPAGHITKVYYFTDTAGDLRTTNNSPTVACTPMSFTAVEGRKYIVIGNQQLATSNETGTAYKPRILRFGLYYGTTSRATGDNVSDTEIYQRTIGIAERPSTTAGNAQYQMQNYTGYFTAGSSVTHYVYTSIYDEDGQSKANYAHNDADKKHFAVIYEVMP
jgi:hypothetical protein